jgi:uncharacterized lipoprotein NlpE involved in copper resistance
MMKKRVIIGTALAAILALTGCGAKNNIDTKELAAKLAQEGEFTESLKEVSEKITEKYYALSEDEVEECVSYRGTNATVDEVAVFKTNDIENVKNKVYEHISSQEEMYKSYAPDEVSKLNSCVVEVSGDYVILCVSSDASAAEKIISEYIK